VVTVAAGSLLMVAVSSFASSLPVSSDALGAAASTVPRCASGALTVAPNLSSSNVASVTVSGIPSTCGGGTLAVTVNNGTTYSSGSAAVPGGGGAVTVTLATAVAVTSGMQLETDFTGP